MWKVSIIPQPYEAISLWIFYKRRIRCGLASGVTVGVYHHDAQLVRYDFTCPAQYKKFRVPYTQLA